MMQSPIASLVCLFLPEFLASHPFRPVCPVLTQKALLRRLEEDYRPQSRNWNLLQGPMSKVFALAQEEAAKQDGSEMQL